MCIHIQNCACFFFFKLYIYIDIYIYIEIYIYIRRMCVCAPDACAFLRGVGGSKPAVP